MYALCVDDPTSCVYFHLHLPPTFTLPSTTSVVEVVQKFCDVSCPCFDHVSLHVVCDTDNAEQENTREVRAEISLANLALGRASVDCHALIHDGDALRLQQRLNMGLLEVCVRPEAQSNHQATLFRASSA